MSSATWSWGILLAAVAAILTLLAARGLIKIGHQRGWLDFPDSRKRHPTAVPPLGGVGIFVVFWLIVLLSEVIRPTVLSLFRPEALPIFAGGFAIFLVGLVDDFQPLRAGHKLAAQVVVALWLWGNGLQITLIWVPTVGGVPLGPLSLPVTFLWFLILVNAINIIDGLDGLAAGVSMIGLVSLMITGIRLHIPDVIVLSFVLFGSLAGFLAYNRPPARIFLGDSGSLTLGYFFAVMAMWLPIKRYTVVAVYVPLLALLVPLLEAGLSVIRRTSQGARPMSADRGHIHFRLLERGLSERAVRTIFFGLSGIGVLFSLAVAYGNRRLWLVVFGFFMLLLSACFYILLRSSKIRGDG